MKIARRHILRGAGIALALPWLGSLERPRAQAARPRRFVPVFFPNGTGSYWSPQATGAGSAWQLSPILEPLEPLKERVTVLSHVGATAYEPTTDPANAGLTGSFLTCVRCAKDRLSNGVSIDLRIASTMAGLTPLPALQVGLSTLDSYVEGYPPAYSRSISWASASEPLYKLVNPQTIFDRLVSLGLPASQADPAGRARRAAKKSVLDFVMVNPTSIRPQLGRTDGNNLDQFLDSVRDVEKRIASMNDPKAVDACGTAIRRPSLAAEVGDTPQGYDRGEHASIMIDLIVMALSCNLTRVASFMLDDARSDFAYGFLRERKFTPTGWTPGTGPVGSFHGLTQAGDTNDGWATIDQWFASKVAELCQKMQARTDGDGQTLLDNSVVWFGSGQHEGNGGARDLPLLYVGNGGGVLRTDRHIALAAGTPLANVYLTFLRRVFGVNDAAFGDSTGEVADLLA